MGEIAQPPLYEEMQILREPSLVPITSKRCILSTCMVRVRNAYKTEKKLLFLTLESMGVLLVRRKEEEGMRLA